MSKKNRIRIGKIAETFNIGDTVRYIDSGELATIVGLSRKYKNNYIIEYHETEITRFEDTATVSADMIQIFDAKAEHDRGYKEGIGYADLLLAEIIGNLKQFAQEHSRDFAEGYLKAVNAEVFNLGSNLDELIAED
jgi:hypothetical protein